MAGLLDMFGGMDDPRTVGLLGLAMGLMQKGTTPGRATLGEAFSNGLGGGMQAYSSAKRMQTDEELKRQELALKKSLADSEISKTDIEKQRLQAAIQEAQRKEQMAQLQSQFWGALGQPITGGQAASAGGGPTNAAAQMIGQPMPFSPAVAARALQLGIDPEKVRAVVESKNWGRDKVERTVDTVDEQGRPVTMQMDQFGNPIGKPLGQWKAPVQVSQGDRTSFVNPVSLQQLGSFGINISPDAALSAETARRGQNMTDARSREANGIAATTKVTEMTSGLRKEFDQLPEVKNYKLAYPSFAAIVDASKRNTPASDINLVYGIAKLYDPTSVVREGEYNTVANNAAIPDRIKGWASYLAGGAKLTPQVRAQLMQEAQGRIATFENEYKKAQQGFGGIATRMGISPTDVFSHVGRVRADGTLVDPTPMGMGTSSVSGTISKGGWTLTPMP